jgi:hypothetical protein
MTSLDVRALLFLGWVFSEVLLAIVTRTATSALL